MQTNFNTVNFYFEFHFQNEIIVFQEVSGIANQLGTEDMILGGENRFVHRIPNSSKYENLKMKRGIALANSKFGKWCSPTEMNFKPNDVRLKLMNSTGNCLKKWIFYEAYPIAHQFDLQENNLMIKLVELVYSYSVVDDNG